jgi:hypothetical protein
MTDKLTAMFPIEAAREILTKAVRPVFADWGLDEQAMTALVDVLIALLRHDYNFDALRDMLLQIEMNLDDDEFE